MSELMPRSDADHLASVIKALADPGRLQLLSLLTSGEKTQQELIQGLDRLSQPAVAHHLRILAAAGFVHVRRAGVFSVHSIDRRVATVIAALTPGGAR